VLQVATLSYVPLLKRALTVKYPRGIDHGIKNC
jgi:hypothetical protein